MRKLILLGALLLLVIIISHAQEEDIWFTTQDNLALRLGPGQHWERLAVIPAGTTFQAVARTANTDWIQLAYQGQLDPDATDEGTVNGVTYGWVSTRYLVWTGNVLLLPIEDVEVVATSRMEGATVLIQPETIYYETLGDFANPIQGAVSAPTRAEITGRLGSSSNTFYWLQFNLNGAYYWIPSFGSGRSGRTNDLLDASYLFPFGRVANAFDADQRTASSKLNIIRGRWWDLDAGFATTCNRIPAQMVISRQLTETNDVQRVPIFQSPLALLQSAVDKLNAAIANYEAVCAQPLDGRTASAEIIAESLTLLEVAADELNLLGVLLESINTRNPIVRN